MNRFLLAQSPLAGWYIMLYVMAACACGALFVTAVLLLVGVFTGKCKIWSACFAVHWLLTLGLAGLFFYLSPLGVDVENDFTYFIMYLGAAVLFALCLHSLAYLANLIRKA
jgi:hypothetical protein